MITLNNIQDIIFVSIGAVLGANSRFIIYQKLKKININGRQIIFFINVFSSFLLGLFTSISSQLLLFFLIGFLGSLSTFSSFVYDLFDSYLKLKFFRALKLYSLSFSLGTIALALGTFLAS